MYRAVSAAFCALVIASLVAIAEIVGSTIEWQADPADANYNLLVRGFEAGQLNLVKEIPAGFAKLADPYDSTSNQDYRYYPYFLHDMSYFRGKLYLYYGVGPALILFWPWAVVSDHYLTHRHAAEAFCVLAFLAASAMVIRLGRRFFPTAPPLVIGACLLAAGLASGLPDILQRPGVCEVAICCGCAMAMVSLFCLLRCLENPSGSPAWLAGASAAYGLAVASRPSLAFGAIILALPLLRSLKAGPEKPPAGRMPALAAAGAVPVALAGVGLMIYNLLRFGDPFEFGQHYQLLVGSYRGAEPTFSVRYFLYNLKVYFLEPAGLAAQFPFVRDIAAGPMPRGHAVMESPFGVLVNTPFTMLALAAPLAWRGAAGAAGSVLRWFTGALVIYMGIAAVTLACFWGACYRYEVDFLPALILLAVLGVLGLERALAGRPGWRRPARWGWGALLSVSVAFNLCSSFQHYAEQAFQHGRLMIVTDRLPEAAADFRRALRLQPDFPGAWNDLASALDRQGRHGDAIEAVESALRTHLDDAGLHYNLGLYLYEAGRSGEAAAELESALQIDPHFDKAARALELLKRHPTGAIVQIPEQPPS